MEKFDQSGVIPFRKHNGAIEVLIISTRNGNWTIPKGIIEYNHTPQESALKECIEEAGVWGVIDEPKVGSFKYKKWGGICHVKVYKMKVTKVLSKWEEDDFRERLWIPLSEVPTSVKNKKLVDLIINGFEKELKFLKRKSNGE